MRIGTIAAAALALSVAAAGAQTWNERTELTFSEPVMIPGATLEPGTYVFRLTESRSNRHLVEIRDDGGEIVSLTQAVPTRRLEAKGAVVLKFNPTEQGAPAAIAAWYYPGSIYGHEFVYPEEQARKIAERTRTLVLSTDEPGTDLERGRLMVYDASGVAKQWTPDAGAVASWEKWYRDRRARAGVVSGAARGDRAESAARAIDAQFQGTRVSLDTLEKEGMNWIGRTVSVDAEVEEVYGPRLFSIDEPNWADMEGEILVYMPATMAALVREDDRVTVSGTVQKFVKDDFANQWGWLDPDDQAEVRLGRRPVLVADRIIGGNDNRAFVVNVGDDARMASDRVRPDTPVGTSGATGTTGAVTDLGSLADADDEMVGRHVKLDAVRIESKARDGGFYARAGASTVFVLPAGAQQVSLNEGDTVSLDGVVLQMPRHMEDRLKDGIAGRSLNDEIYVYATRVQR